MWLSADRRLIHADATATSLALLRIWVFGLWAAFAWRDPLNLLAELPKEIFVPLGVLRLVAPQEVIDLILTPAGLGGVKAAVVVFSAAAAAGVLTRVSAVLAAVALVVWQTINRGFAGYANHAEIPLLLAAIVLAVSPCDRALTIWPRPRRELGPAAYQFPLVAILALICTTYLFIGGYRVAHGGLALLRSEALSEWILSWNLREPDPAATLGVRWIANPGTELAGRVGFGLLTLLEVTAPVCLLSARYRAFFLVAMLLAHTGILLLMRIDFTAQALSYLVFIDSRHWSPVPARGADPPIVFFDGVCGLCNRFVDFVLCHDRARRLRFAPLQGSTAPTRLAAPGESAPETVVFVEDGVTYERSTAVLRILGRMGAPWSLAAVFGLVPSRVRNAAYDWVARRRYAWFGRRETCRLPSPEERAVFLP